MPKSNYKNRPSSAPFCARCLCLCTNYRLGFYATSSLYLFLSIFSLSLSLSHLVSAEMEGFAKRERPFIFSFRQLADFNHLLCYTASFFHVFLGCVRVLPSSVDHNAGFCGIQRKSCFIIYFSTPSSSVSRFLKF